MLESLKWLDRALLLKINACHSPLFDTFMWQMSESWHTVLFVLGVGVLFFKRFNTKKAVEFLIAVVMVFAFSDFTSNFVKRSVQRYRPTHNLEIKEKVHTVNAYSGGKFGFISGHATNTFAVITFIFLALGSKNKKYRFLLFIYPALIAYSRIYLGVHYPSDVIVGGIYGVTLGLLGYRFVNLYLFKLNDQTV
jgi:undecaprenyl-diphosphatase